MKMTRRRVLQIFASRSWGGGEQYVLDLSQGLINQGYELFFVCKPSTIIEQKLVTMGNHSALELPMKGILDLGSAIKLGRIIKDNGIEIVHIHHFKDAATTLLACRFARRRVKVVLTRHLVRPGKGGAIYGWIYRGLDKIIFVSNLARQEFLTTNPPIETSKIEVIHNSIPAVSALSQTEDYRKRYSIPQNHSLVSYIGRLDLEKGVHTLIEALALMQCRDFTLIIAGEGDISYKTQLGQLVADFGLEKQVFFIGFVNNVHELIEQVDIGVMPSIVKESFGLTVLEYMRAGKPVVTTNNGAQVEFIENNITGILVPVNDPMALGSQIEMLINSPNQREMIGNKAKEKYDTDMNYDVFLKNINAIYQSL